jgi:hypothetical protein
MTRREKIILAVTGVVAVVAAVYLLLDTGPAVAPQPGGQVQAQAVAQTQAAAQAREAAQTLVRQAAPGGVQTALMAALDKPWRVAILYDKPLEARGGTGRPTVVPRFTGYVELGSGRLAVIDGYEYQAGDTLEGGGYKVLAVSPDKVTLESLANGQRLDIPYDGQDALGR